MRCFAPRWALDRQVLELAATAVVTVVVRATRCDAVGRGLDDPQQSPACHPPTLPGRHLDEFTGTGSRNEHGETVQPAHPVATGGDRIDAHLSHATAPA